MTTFYTIIGTIVVTLLVVGVLAYRRTRQTDTTDDAPEVERESLVDVQQNRPLYFAVLIVWAALIGATFIFYVIPSWGAEEGVLEARLTGVVLAVYVGFSLMFVRLNEFGALTFFGKPTITLGPGAYPAPWGLFKRYHVSAEVHEFYWPAKLDNIFYGDDEVPVPAGKERAWRYLSGAPKKPVLTKQRRKELVEREQKDSGATQVLADMGVDVHNVLNVQQVIAVSGFSTWRVLRDRVFQYIIAASNDPAQVNAQMFGYMRTLLAQQVSKYTVGDFNAHLEKVGAELRESVDRRMRQYGVFVDTTEVNSPNISHEFAKAIRDSNEARARAVATKVTADGDYYAAVRKAEGERALAREPIIGRGEGVKQAAESMGLEPASVFAGQVAENTMGEGDMTVLGTESLNNVLGGLTAQIAKNMRRTPTPQDTGDNDE